MYHPCVLSLAVTTGKFSSTAELLHCFDLMNIHDQAEREGGSLLHGSSLTCCCRSSHEGVLQRKQRFAFVADARYRCVYISAMDLRCCHKLVQTHLICTCFNYVEQQNCSLFGVSLTATSIHFQMHIQLWFTGNRLSKVALDSIYVFRLYAKGS